MLKFKFLLPILVLSAFGAVHAELKPGANLAPYEVHNTSTGKEYCQMCAFSSKPATIGAYGKLNDAEFWADLKKLQDIQGDNKNVGIFAQVIDSQDAAAIQAEAKKNGITFPVVYATDKDWDKVYKVEGVSRTVYYSKEFKVAWSSVGLDDKAVAAIKDQLKSDVKS